MFLFGRDDTFLDNNRPEYMVFLVKALDTDPEN
jgi:hypothetical protein